MYEIREAERKIDGRFITTYRREIALANILEVEAGTNGYHGGDSGHGSRTYIRIQDAGCTDIDVKPLQYGCGVVVTLGGDSELMSIIEALKFAVMVLEDQVQNE